MQFIPDLAGVPGAVVERAFASVLKGAGTPLKTFTPPLVWQGSPAKSVYDDGYAALPDTAKADLDAAKKLVTEAAPGWVFSFAAVVCVLVALVALLAPWIAPHDPNAVDPLNAYAPFSPAHPLGTDDLGRDLLSRRMVGSRTSLAGPSLVILLSGAAGTALAVSAAWIGGWFDAAVSRVLDILFAFPGLVLAITVTAVFGAGFVAPVVALSLAYVPIIARIMRAAALRERSLPYIEALRVQGFSGWHICRGHLLPNLAPLLVVQAAISFGYAMIDLASISYLGLGLQPPAADWGLMIANGQPSILAGFPQQSIEAAVAVVVTVVAFTVVAERLAVRFGGEVR